MCDDMKFEKSSGNVFKDIDFSDEEAEALSFRTKLSFEVFTLLKQSRLKSVKAANLLAVDPTDISKLKNGDDDHFSLACLSEFRDRLRHYVKERGTLSENNDRQNITDVLGVGKSRHPNLKDWACASSQFAFPRKRLISAPQRDHRQPVKCLSQR